MNLQHIETLYHQHFQTILLSSPVPRSTTQHLMNGAVGHPKDIVIYTMQIHVHSDPSLLSRASQISFNMKFIKVVYLIERDRFCVALHLSENDSDDLSRGHIFKKWQLHISPIHEGWIILPARFQSKRGIGQ